MNIIIKATNIELSPDLEKWIQERLGPLSDLEDFLQKQDVEMWVEIGKTTKDQRKGNIFRAEAQIRLPKKSIRVESVTDDLKKSVNEIKDKLQREIVEYKERISNV